jgi:hypothetical protein
MNALSSYILYRNFTVRSCRDAVRARFFFPDAPSHKIHALTTHEAAAVHENFFLIFIIVTLTRILLLLLIVVVLFIVLLLFCWFDGFYIV